MPGVALLDLNRTLRIGVLAERKPSSYPCVTNLTVLVKNENCTRLGWENELWARILDHIALPYELVNIPSWVGYGHQQDDVWSGALGLLQNDTFDTINCAFVITRLAMKHFIYI